MEKPYISALTEKGIFNKGKPYADTAEDLSVRKREHLKAVKRYGIINVLEGSIITVVRKRK